MKKEEFEALPKNEQCVLIAKDVLKQLKKEAIFASGGHWVYLSDDDAEDAGINKFAPLQQQINKLYGCTVCALGACMISAVKFKNKYTIAELSNISPGDFITSDAKNSDLKYLLGSFSKAQLRLIEEAFELGFGAVGNSYKPKTNKEEKALEVARNFGKNYEQDNERLVAIMKNIIKNKGVFIPQ